MRKPLPDLRACSNTNQDVRDETVGRGGSGRKALQEGQMSIYTCHQCLLSRITREGEELESTNVARSRV